MFNIAGAIHFIYSHKYNTTSAEDSSDMSCKIFRADFTGNPNLNLMVNGGYSSHVCSLCPTTLHRSNAHTNSTFMNVSLSLYLYVKLYIFG